MWVKKYYSEKGYGKGKKRYYRWVWEKSKPQVNMLDETCFNKPKGYTSEYAHSTGKRITTRQYKNGKSAICVVTPKGSFAKIVNKRVERITLEDKAELLKSLGITEVYCDRRSLGLTKFGITTRLISKRFNLNEKRFGYKTAIHKLPMNAPQHEVETLHLEYLSKLYTIVY